MVFEREQHVNFCLHVMVKYLYHSLQVFAIEFVLFAVDFGTFAVEFIGFAIEFVALAVEFHLCMCLQ